MRMSVISICQSVPALESRHHCHSHHCDEFPSDLLSAPSNETTSATCSNPSFDDGAASPAYAQQHS
jgi:hypothetical protein